MCLISPWMQRSASSNKWMRHFNIMQFNVVVPESTFHLLLHIIFYENQSINILYQIRILHFLGLSGKIRTSEVPSHCSSQ